MEGYWGIASQVWGAPNGGSPCETQNICFIQPIYLNLAEAVPNLRHQRTTREPLPTPARSLSRWSRSSRMSRAHLAGIRNSPLIVPFVFSRAETQSRREVESTEVVAA